MSAARSKQAERSDAVAVSDDFMTEQPENWLRVGAWVAVVCADPIYHGQIVGISPSHYYLSQASWVPDTGRAHKFAENPKSAAEVEFLGEIAVERPVVAIYRLKVSGGLETK